MGSALYLCTLNKEYQISMAHAQFMSSNLFLYIPKDVRIKISSSSFFFFVFIFRFSTVLSTIRTHNLCSETTI